MPRYKDPVMQRVYDTLLQLAADPASEMYTADGRQHGGANVRCAFWDGYNGLDIQHRIPAGTPLAAAYAAGKQYAKQAHGSPRRGRPAKHPEGTTAADRATLSVQRRAGLGIHRKTFTLGPEALAALESLRKRSRVPVTESSVVETLLLAAAQSHSAPA